MERVSIIEGTQPVIFVAPHGAATDDTHTDIIAETAAELVGGYAVINRGWERADQVDYFKDKANCNNIKHCHEDVVKDEFLDPILRFKARIRKKHTWGYMITVHGVGNDIRAKTGNPDLGIIIGYGAGNPASHSCKTWMKDMMIFLFRQAGVETFGGQAGGAYAGWTKTNLNQLWCKWPQYVDANMHSLQIEFVRALRSDKAHSEYTGVMLADVVNDMMQHGKWVAPSGFKTQEV